MKTKPRLTIIEILLLASLAGVIGAVAWSQYQSLSAMHRDQDRKTAINAMHHNLEEIALPTLKGYPRTLQAQQLSAMNERLLKDPNGNRVGEADSDYRYEPTNCNGSNVCRDYTLRASLELESDYIKTSPQKN